MFLINETDSSPRKHNHSVLNTPHYNKIKGSLTSMIQSPLVGGSMIQSPTVGGRNSAFKFQIPSGAIMNFSKPEGTRSPTVGPGSISMLSEKF
jgi:hypothetical protein